MRGNHRGSDPGYLTTPGTVELRGSSGKYLFSVLAAPVAQTCSLSVSLEIIAGRDDSLLRRFFFLAPRRRSGQRTEERGCRLLSPALSSIRWRRGSVALRLRRAALYRRFLTCHLPFASNVLPITNRTYGRLKICATLNTYPGKAGGLPGS